MATTPDYTILSAPRISAAKFAQILTAAGSPARTEAAAEYAAFVAAGVDPTVGLAVFRKESTFGRFGYARANRSWGNIRGAPALNGGGFRTYSSWTAGAADAARLLAIYGRNEIRPGRDTSTVQTFHYVWAPSSDNNAPDLYGDRLAAWIQQWSGQPGSSSTGAPAAAPDATLAGYTVSDQLLEGFLASIGRQLTDPIRAEDVFPFVRWLQTHMDGFPGGSPNDNPLVNAVLLEVQRHVGQPWNTLGGALQSAAGNQDPFGLNAALQGLAAGLGDVLTHVVILLGILAVLGLGLYLLATSDQSPAPA